MSGHWLVEECSSLSLREDDAPHAGKRPGEKCRLLSIAGADTGQRQQFGASRDGRPDRVSEGRRKLPRCVRLRKRAECGQLEYTVVVDGGRRRGVVGKRRVATSRYPSHAANYRKQCFSHAYETKARLAELRMQAQCARSVDALHSAATREKGGKRRCSVPALGASRLRVFGHPQDVVRLLRP